MVEATRLQSAEDFAIWARSMCGSGAHCVAIIDPSRYPTVEECRDALGLDERAFTALPNLYSKYASSIREAGPRIFDAGPESPVWGRLFPEALTRQSASFVILPEGATGLLSHLAQLVRMPQSDGGNLLFRFQDVVVLSALAPVLTTVQKRALLGPARHWLAADLCGYPIAIESPQVLSARSLVLRLNKSQLSALDDAVAPFTVIFQAEETDRTLLAGMSRCQQVQLIRERMHKARRQGLRREDDVALYCILSLQLSDEFDRVGPIAEALERARRRGTSFGDEIDRVPTHRWREWDETLEVKDAR